MSPSDTKIGLKMNCVTSRELYKADFVLLCFENTLEKIRI